MLDMKMLVKTFWKNVGSNVFSEKMLVQLFFKKMLVKLCMKNDGSTFI
jgi:sulfur relay (sulfurtransferase) DsrC/TusE family protein